MIVPDACAPPAHIETSAVVASRRSSSCSAVVSNRVPVDPTGCPSAMAPPLTLIFSSGTACTLAQDITTAANASLTSQRSMSAMVMPVSARSFSVAWTGPSRW